MEVFTELNCKSATHVINAVVFYYIHMILYTLFNVCHVYMWPYFIRFVRFVILKLPFLPNCFRSLTSQFSTFLRDLLASVLATK